MALATFAAGCFWGVEAAFQNIDGVLQTTVGYSGGHTQNPTYKQVCNGDTGHAESLTLEYDPTRVSYEQLLDIFWQIHNPTQLNRQGPDIGSQYRSIIFYHTQEQEQQALASKEALGKTGKYKNSIVTEIIPAQPFYNAEDYHQRYYEKHGISSCHINLKDDHS